jgi:hypothetical protein
VTDAPISHNPVAARRALGRLLSREDRISDLVAFLAALDSQPLLTALDLLARDPQVGREDVLGQGAGRADLVVWDGSQPLALLEIKAAAGQHGDQFDRYDLWARTQVPEVKCHLISLEGKLREAPAGWMTELTLPALFRSWQGSRHPHASWLASSVADVLEEWVAQLDGKIGRATYPVVADLVTRQVVADLASVDRLARAGLEVEATRTSGGTAMIIAWLPFPSDPQDPNAWLCVDLRSMSRADPQVRWLLRLGVEVEDKAPRTTGQARAAAHDLAMPMRAALTFSALQESVQRAGHEDLAAALRPRPGSYDGLRGEPDDSALAAWRASVLTAERSGPHPALFHDKGLRLASQIDVNVVELDRHQLLRLFITALDHINGRAWRRP